VGEKKKNGKLGRKRSSPHESKYFKGSKQGAGWSGTPAHGKNHRVDRGREGENKHLKKEPLIKREPGKSSLTGGVKNTNWAKKSGPSRNFQVGKKKKEKKTKQGGVQEKRLWL